MHAITSIFCDNVLEEVTCGANFLRCCVPHEFSFGTPVETSAPITPTDHSDGQPPTHTSNGFQSTTSPTTTTDIPPETSSSVHSSITSHPLRIRPHDPKPYTPAVVFGSLNVNKMTPSSVPLSHASSASLASSTSPIPSITSTTITTTTTTTNTAQQSLSSNSHQPTNPSQLETSLSSGSALAEPCPGVCIKLRYIRYCGNILSNGKCIDEADQCCLQSELDFDNSSSIVTVVQQSDTFNPTRDHTEELWSQSHSDKPKVDEKEINANGSDTSSGSSSSSGPTTPMPLCEGTCVAPLFSLLCDETDANLYCPNGGTCCVNREATTEAPPPTPCPGNCIPTILSGMCNRPSELILKTLDCSPGSICCHNPHQSNEETIKETNIEQLANEPTKDQAYIEPIEASMPSITAQNINQLLFGSENSRPPLFASGPAIQRPIHTNPKPNLNPNRMPPLLTQPISHSSPPINLVRPPSLPIQEPNRVPPMLSKPVPEADLFDAVEESENKSSTVKRPPGGPPFCPGPCIAPMFRYVPV